MNVCLVSVVTVWHGVNGGIEIHGKLLTEGLVGLGHSVTVVASRHPAGVGAEARSGVRIRYARAGQFGSQGGAWAGEGTRLVSARHLEAPIEAGLALLLLFNLLDCVDGSIARAMGTGNPYGRFLDSACGAVVDLGFWAAVGIAAFRHPSLLAKPEGFGHGPFLWLVAARSPCLLAAYVGQLERSFDELVRSEWVRL